ncbi:MAG TPA: hypothetical protein VLW85_10620 [Myxococcales bacterium]|nr:hypothetical protein [Myxococcales bacterium]
MDNDELTRRELLKGGVAAAIALQAGAIAKPQAAAAQGTELQPRRPEGREGKL